MNGEQVFPRESVIQSPAEQAIMQENYILPPPFPPGPGFGCVPSIAPPVVPLVFV